MNQNPHEPSDLSELFEQSASALDPVAHGRLRALARELPERQRAFWQLPRWAWAAGLCALSAAGAIALVSLRTTPRANPIAILSASHSPRPATRASAQEPVAIASVSEAEPADEVDELASGTDFDDASGPNLLDDLALDPGDLADSEVDAWISAANTTLGG